MKNFIVILITLLSYNFSIAQIVNIPDPVFKNILVNTYCVDTNGDGIVDGDADTNDDGEIQVTEAEAVQGLYFDNNSIVSLEGLQSFIGLLGLGFGGNNISSIDLSQLINIEILAFGDVQLTSIDLSQNINLLDLRIGESQITSLNLENNPQLEFLSCHHSPITSIDVSQNTNLLKLNCYDTLITEINLTNNQNLEDLGLWNNNLTNLNISQLPNLREIQLDNNQISNLDVSNNPNLESLIADNNLITSLNFSNNPNLVRVTVSNNNLSSLNLKNGNNSSVFKMWAQDNPNLNCIQVDDVNYPITQVCTSSNGWCKDETVIYSEDCNLGIGDVVLNEAISLFPNPVKNKLQISIQNTIALKKVVIYNVLGKSVLVSDALQLDVSGLASGLFFVHITTNQGALVKKVVKE